MEKKEKKYKSTWYASLTDEERITYIEKQKLRHANLSDEKKAEYKLKTKEKYWNNVEENRKKALVYTRENRDKVLVQKKRYREKNREKILLAKKLYREDNWDKIKRTHSEWSRNKKKTCPLFRLSTRIRKTIAHSIKNSGLKKSKRTEEILGCSFEFFKAHIESQFQPWMTWDNRGLFNGTIDFGWDLDHIIPMSSAKTEEDVLRLNHYSNFQPLCGFVNRFVKKDIVSDIPFAASVYL